MVSIYNYLELKQFLIDEFGVGFTTTTDTEVLYELLLNLKLDEVLNKINGIFAFSFFSSQEKKLYLVRDQIGVKPYLLLFR